MQRWTVTDRDGRPVYLTQERWKHIVDGHPELTDHFEEVLEAIHTGSRHQDIRDPQKYRYRQICRTLPAPYSLIEVVVIFRWLLGATGVGQPNNFVLTAYGKLR